jgi:twitching motility two-component system response regulator PilG
MASRVLNLLDKINEKPILVDDISNLKPMVNKQSTNQVFDNNFHSNDELDLGFYILVVDDSVPMQKALAAEIKKLEKPTKIDFSDTGEQALLYVERNNYDFIFLDIVMPGIDGFETCTRMRKIPKLKKIPIIMLSAKTSPLDEVKGVMAGCTTYMTKPIVHEEFQKVISRISKWIETVYKKDSVS